MESYRDIVRCETVYRYGDGHEVRIPDSQAMTSTWNSANSFNVFNYPWKTTAAAAAKPESGLEWLDRRVNEICALSGLK